MNELLALIWNDADLKNGQVSVNKTLSYLINRKDQNGISDKVVSKWLGHKIEII